MEDGKQRMRLYPQDSPMGEALRADPTEIRFCGEGTSLFPEEIATHFRYTYTVCKKDQKAKSWSVVPDAAHALLWKSHRVPQDIYELIDVHKHQKLDGNLKPLPQKPDELGQLETENLLDLEGEKKDETIFAEMTSHPVIVTYPSVTKKFEKWMQSLKKPENESEDDKELVTEKFEKWEQSLKNSENEVGNDKELVTEKLEKRMQSLKKPENESENEKELAALETLVFS